MRFALLLLFACAALACTKKYVNVSSSLSVRAGPGTNYKTVGSLARGASVCVESVSGSWSKVGSSQYVSSQYLTSTNINGGSSASTSTAAPATSCTNYAITATSLNVRKGPGSNYGVVKTVKKGNIVCVVSISGGWAKLNDGNYVSSQYLGSTSSSSTSTTTTSNTSSSTATPSGSSQETSPRPARTTAKSAQLIYYAQGDSRWGRNRFTSINSSSQTYANSACGPTSMAMIVATLVDRSVTPVTLGTLAVSKGYRTANSGTSWGFFGYIANKYGLKCTQTATTNTVVAELKKDNVFVVASMGKGYWTNGGHYIALHSADSTYIYAHDPAKTTRVKNTISSFKSQSKQYFIISK